MSTFALSVLSWVIVAFGSPMGFKPLGLLASFVGFVPFFVAIIDLPAKKRFWAGTFFFTAVQFVELFWLLSHPYNYIYGIYIALSLLIGLQFGLVMLAMTRKNMATISHLLIVPALWTILEWCRLFFFSGFTFGVVGIRLSSTLVTLQSASWLGIYGLSFLILFFNCLLTRSYLTKRWRFSLSTIAIFLGLCIVSFTVLQASKKSYDATHPPLRSLIIHQKLLPEEIEGMPSGEELQKSAFTTWKQIIAALAPYANAKEKIDLILLPEIAVPFAGEAPLYPFEEIQPLFNDFERKPLSFDVTFIDEERAQLSSLAISKALANVFDCPVLIGLEGVERDEITGKRYYFNSAYFIPPGNMPSQRYDKEILLPMGEYIPYEWAKALASHYGLFDSFQKGQGPVIFKTDKLQIGTSICYEDTFSTIMHKNKIAGAMVLTNVTNDGWYPNSGLGKTHLELGRLRTVENGLPLLRSTNFGTSAAIDSLGEITSERSQEDTGPGTFVLDSTVSTFTYPTLYSLWGNGAIVMFALLICVSSLVVRK